MDFERKTYKLGWAFPVAAKGLFTIFLLMATVVLMGTNGGIGALVFFFVMLLLFLIIVFTTIRVYLEPDQAIYKKAYCLFGIEAGSWQQIGEARGLIIKNVQLSDKGMIGSGGGLLPLMSRARFSYNDIGETDNVWLVEAAYGPKQTNLPMAADEAEAFDFVNSMVERCDFEIYLGHFKNDRKLNRNKLRENTLVFQKRPEAFKNRRR